MASQAFERRLLCAFLRGEWEPTPESWVFRENWLVWHRAVLPPKMLEAEIAKMIARASGERRPWAWESLRRLYNRVREHDEPLPPILQTWVDDVVNERVQRPNPAGRKPDSYRNSRYHIAFTVLTEFFGLTQEQALAVMTEATEQSEDTVRSILRRWGS